MKDYAEHILRWVQSVSEDVGGFGNIHTELSYIETNFKFQSIIEVWRRTSHDPSLPDGGIRSFHPTQI